jgi:phage terminase Nu1 subunit (DNA packaging protein)
MAKDSTQEGFAKLVGITQPAVAQLIRKGVLTRGGSLVQWVREYCDNLRKQAAGWQSNDGRVDRMYEAAMLDRARREKQEMDNAKQRGELIDAKVVREGFTFTFVAVKTKLLGAPYKFRSQCPQIDPKDLAVLDSIIRESLSDLDATEFHSSIRQYLEDMHAAAEASPQIDGQRVGGPLSSPQLGK